jgi:FAD/FMN-containing dehydrogenase
VFGLAVFFGTEADALRFVLLARESRAVAPRCIEYFDDQAVGIARSAKSGASIPPLAAAMVYVEEEIADDLDSSLGRWADLLESVASEFEPAVFDGDARLREARAMRHSIPSTMNERGAKYFRSGGRKVSTDWAVPYLQLGDAVGTARRIAADLDIPQAVIYGHAGNGHPHQNFIARDETELATIEKAVERTLSHVISLGGTVAAEHGIGKLKRRWLPLQMNPLQIAMMAAVKRELDPYGLLAPGNIL